MIDYVNSDLFMQNNVDKQLIIYFDEKNLTNESIYYEQFSLTESICTDSQLKFGGCESSMLNFRITNQLAGATIDNLKGKMLTVNMVINNDYANSIFIGKFKVDTDQITSDNEYRDITAYDVMYDLLNTDIAEWYNGIIFPITLKDFRSLLFEKLEIEQETIDLPNDNAVLQVSPYANKIFAGDVLKDICELNACFGKINRYGVFEYKFFGKEIDYKITPNMYKKGAVQYDNFNFIKIGGIILRQNGSSNETILSIESNPYTVETRVLYFGEDSTALNTICSNMYNVLYQIRYTPFSVDCRGNPCVECGDCIEFKFSNEKKIKSYLLERKLSGIQNLNDNYSANAIPDFTYSRNDNNLSNSINSSINSLRNDIFFARTFVNSLEYTISDKDTTIIQFNITGSQNADVIFMATIPIYTDYDGNLALSYTIDAVEQEYSNLQKYLHKGHNIVTVVNHFKFDNSARMTLNVNVHMNYIESIQRLQTARILAIENYIATGTYNTPQIDTTLAKGKIELEAIKAVIFAQGLVETAGWDGTINVAQEFSRIDFVDSFGFNNMQEQVTVNTQEPITNSTVNQNLTRIEIADSCNIVGIKESVGNKTVLECCYINTEYAPNYTYNNEYVDISENDFRLRSKWSFESSEQPIDDGTMATVEIYSEDKAKIKSIEFTEFWEK